MKNYRAIVAFAAAVVFSPTILFAQDEIAPVAPGYFQSHNVRWGQSPKMFTRNFGGPQAMHFSSYSHPAHEPYLSVSFFPQSDLQLDDLDQLSFQSFIPKGTLCNPEDLRMVIQLDDGNGNTPLVQIFSASSRVCTRGEWKTINFLNAGEMTWYAAGIGMSSGDHGGAHAAAIDALGEGYRIRVVRATILGEDDAWIDKVVINLAELTERFQDLSLNALLPDSDLVGPGGATSYPVALGYFQSRNVRWGISPALESRNFGQQAMHYAPYTHSDAEPFMSTTFFPQNNLQVKDLYQLGFQMFVPTGTTCTGGSPRFNLVLSNGVSERVVQVYSDKAENCAAYANRWVTLDYMNESDVRWASTQLGLGSNTTQEAVHTRAVAELGGGYQVTRIRIQFDGGSGPEAWFDNKTVNNLIFADRAQDFSQNMLLPDADTSGFAP